MCIRHHDKNGGNVDVQHFSTFHLFGFAPYAKEYGISFVKRIRELFLRSSACRQIHSQKAKNMAFWFGILGAIVVCSIITLIFKYATKSKSYDEAMAEQRKLERNLMRAKSKQSQSKKPKVTKESSQPEKRSKTAPAPATVIKDTKKVEPVKNNPVNGVDKVDGNVNSAKKKNDKVQTKSTPSNPTITVKLSAENTDDDAGPRVDINDNTVKKKPTPVAKTDDVSTTPADTETKKISGDVSGADGATNTEPEVVAKEKPAKASKATPVIEPGDNPKSKTANLPESNDKPRDTKKSILKGESEENIAKSGGGKPAKGEDKTGTKETKSKQSVDDKCNQPEEKVVKHEDIKVVEKAPPSPIKNKKTENNESQPTVAGDPVPAEQNAVKEAKEPAVTKAEKSGAKKSNNAGPNGITSGKTSPVASSKSQKPSNNVKATKKQTNDIKTLQKLSDENNGPVSVNLLMPLIMKAELSRSEYQNLIDLLLNKQQENCIDAEWIEGGRQDPMVKLKKQLAEKEKALCDEQEAHQAIQSKLKELRSELNVEKHTNRQLEETINARQVDLQTLNARLQATAEEKQNFTKQLQQLQSKLNEERMIVNSLKDENSKTKSNLQHELLSQRQQLELHIAHLNEQHQQDMMAIEAQLNQLASQLQEQEATNAQLTDQIQEYVLVRERLVHQENQIAHLQQTIMQLEELRPIKVELERLHASSQFEVKRLTNELQSLTDQLNRRNAEIKKFNHTIQNMKIENQELFIENSRNNEQIKFAYDEKAQLQMENEKLRNELQKLSDQCHSDDNVVRLESELESYRNTIADRDAEITLLNDHVAVLKNSEEQQALRNRTLEEENKSVNELKETLQKQMKKNDELRSKNWKVMEALSSMEKTLEAKVKGMQCIPHEIKTKERELIIHQLKNVLPVATEINDSTIADDKIWANHLDKILQEINQVHQLPTFSAPSEDTFVAKECNVSMLDELEKQNKQLQSMVSHYKSIISDTEGMLNSLQNHVELEENRWGEQIRLLQAELNAITEERNLLLHKMKVQNGCVQNDVHTSEQKVNGIDKVPSILTPSSPVNKTVMSS